MANGEGYNLGYLTQDGTIDNYEDIGVADILNKPSEESDFYIFHGTTR